MKLMVFKYHFAAVALMASLAACGGDPSEPGPDPQPGPALDAPSPDEGFQIDLGHLEIAPGQEGLHCLAIPLPARYAGTHAYMTGFESVFSNSTHHFFVAYNPDANAIEKEGPCYGDEALLPIDAFDVPDELVDQHAEINGAKFLAGTGEGVYNMQLPDGYGMLLDQGDGFLVTNWHILNVGAEPADVSGVLNIYATPQAAVTHPVRSLNCLLTDVSLPPHSERSVSATCTVPFDLDLVVVASHAHQYLTRFEARFFDGSDTLPDPIYVSDDWDSPDLKVLDQPLSLTAGQGINFTCHYRNDTDSVVEYGSGEFGEMCASMNGYALPKDQPNELPPTLGMIVSTAGDVVELVDTTSLDGPF